MEPLTSPPAPFTLGVTGGIGSGKSTVCRMLEARGARVFYADAEAKALMERDPRVGEALRAAFGPESYGPDGRLNRAYLAQTVFGDEAAVARLNAIVHPRVYEAFSAAREEARRQGVGLLVLEAALLFESGGDRHLDAVAVVEAPPDTRVARVAARDAADPAAVRVRMAHQIDPAEARRRADFVVVNDGSEADLARAVDRLWDAIAQGRLRRRG